MNITNFLITTNIVYCDPLGQFEVFNNWSLSVYPSFLSIVTYWVDCFNYVFFNNSKFCSTVNNYSNLFKEYIKVQLMLSEKSCLFNETLFKFIFSSLEPNFRTHKLVMWWIFTDARIPATIVKDHILSLFTLFTYQTQQKFQEPLVQLWNLMTLLHTQQITQDIFAANFNHNLSASQASLLYLFKAYPLASANRAYGKASELVLSITQFTYTLELSIGDVQKIVCGNVKKSAKIPIDAVAQLTEQNFAFFIGFHTFFEKDYWRVFRINLLWNPVYSFKGFTTVFDKCNADKIQQLEQLQFNYLSKILNAWNSSSLKCLYIENNTSGSDLKTDDESAKKGQQQRTFETKLNGEIATVLALMVRTQSASIPFMVLLCSILFFIVPLIRNIKLIPLNWQYAFEAIYKFILNILNAQVGKVAAPFFPYVFSMFCFILVANIAGMALYAFTLTSHILVTFTLGVSSFIGLTILGFYVQKLAFLNLFLPKGIPIALIPILLVVEVISYVSRALSLSIRLFANLMSGHTLLHILAFFSSKLFKYKFIIGLLSFLLILAIVVLEFCIAILQAYVFAILICIYLNDSFHGGH